MFEMSGYAIRAPVFNELGNDESPKLGMLLNLLPLVSPRAPADPAFMLGLNGYVFTANTINLNLPANGIGASTQCFSYLPEAALTPM